MADERPVELLTAEEVAEMRRYLNAGWVEWPNAEPYADPVRIVATLEHLQAQLEAAEKRAASWRFIAREE